MLGDTLNNFRLLRSDLNISEIRKEISECNLWVDLNGKPNVAQTQVVTHRIQLRTNVNIPGMHYRDIHESQDMPAWRILANARDFVERFAQEVQGEIGRVRLSNLPVGAEIIPHIDDGGYCAIRDRYHLVINAPNGTSFACDGETVIMRENELWWFDNKKVHSARNLSNVPRTHLVFDICPQITARPTAT